MTTFVESSSKKLEVLVAKLRQRKADQQKELLSQRDIFFAVR